jgi:hypothetical protein
LADTAPTKDANIAPPTTVDLIVSDIQTSIGQ